MRLNVEDAVEQYLEKIEGEKSQEPHLDTQEIPPFPRRKNPIPRNFLPLLDLVLALVAFGLAYVARYDLTIFRPVLDPSSASFAPYVPYALVYAGMLYVLHYGNGLYRNVRGRSWLEEVYTVINGVTSATVILLAMFFVFQPLVTSRLMLVYVAAITIMLLALARAIYRMVLAHLRNKGIGR